MEVVLRHRVDVQEPIIQKDTTGNDVTIGWRTIWPDVPAEIKTISGREFYAAKELQSSANTQITFRWRPGIETTFRLRHYLKAERKYEIFNIEAVLPDDTGRRYLKMLCVRRDAEGTRADG